MEVELVSLVECGSTADWRRRVAETYPEDERNTHAAEHLERLAMGLPSLEDSELHQQLELALFERREDFCTIVSEALREVGFRTFPETAAELLQDIVSRLRC